MRVVTEATVTLSGHFAQIMKALSEIESAALVDGIEYQISTEVKWAPDKELVAE